MKNEYDESFIETFPLKKGKILVEIKDIKGVDDGGIYIKKLLSTIASRFIYKIAFEKINEKCYIGNRRFQKQ